MIEKTLNLVSDKMMVLKNNGMKEKYPVSLIDINCWEWPQGVGLFGLYRYYEMSRKQEVLTFLTEWYDRRMEEGIVEKNVNTTSPMLTLTYLYEITKKESYLSFIKEWADWIMEEKGLIRRNADRENRRNVLVELTPEGLEMARESFLAQTDMEKRLLTMLSPEEKEQLRTLLKRILLDLEERGEV